MLPRLITLTIQLFLFTFSFGSVVSEHSEIRHKNTTKVFSSSSSSSSSSSYPCGDNKCGDTIDLEIMAGGGIQSFFAKHSSRLSGFAPR